MARTEFITLRPRLADLAEACGGNRYVHRTGAHAALVRRNEHQTSIVVDARASRVAGALHALVEELIAWAPAIAAGKRATARSARARAAELLAEADALDVEAAAIDAALALAQETT